MASIFDAATKGDCAAVQDAVTNSADLNRCDEHGWTMLRHAAHAEGLGVTRYLLDQGADVDATTKSRNTALMLAAANRRLVQLLLDNKADPRKTNEDGDTAEDKANEYLHADVAKLLGEACK